MPEQLVHDGICVRLARRASARRMRLTVRADGSVTLTAPKGADEESLFRFLKEHAAGIARMREGLKRKAAHEGRSLWPPASVPVWGEELPLVLVDREEGCGVRVEDGRVVLALPPGSSRPTAEDVLEAWLKLCLRGQIKTLVARWKERIGLERATWRVVSLRTCWASCTPENGSVRFCTSLAQLRRELVEYMVVLQLCRLKAWRGHLARLEELLDRHCPDWRRLDRELDRIRPWRVAPCL